jgi:hypothetical protein
MNRLYTDLLAEIVNCSNILELSNLSNVNSELRKIVDNKFDKFRKKHSENEHTHYCNTLQITQNHYLEKYIDINICISRQCCLRTMTMTNSRLLKKFYLIDQINLIELAIIGNLKNFIWLKTQMAQKPKEKLKEHGINISFIQLQDLDI